MEEVTLTKSLVDGSDFDYISVQAYVREEALHIQIRGPEANRTYGLSADIDLDELGSMVNWLDSITKNFPSMAESNKQYFVCQMRYIASKHEINFQVAWDSYNTPYGGMFVVDANKHQDLLDYWHMCMHRLTKKPQMVLEIED